MTNGKGSARWTLLYGCGSKPESSYESILSRRFDCDYVNLGFSGNAKGENEITDYTVDNCHPTDSGFFSMACAIAEVFDEILL